MSWSVCLCNRFETLCMRCDPPSSIHRPPALYWCVPVVVCLWIVCSAVCINHTTRLYIIHIIWPSSMYRMLCYPKQIFDGQRRTVHLLIYTEMLWLRFAQRITLNMPRHIPPINIITRFVFSRSSVCSIYKWLIWRWWWWWHRMKFIASRPTVRLAQAHKNTVWFVKVFARKASYAKCVWRLRASRGKNVNIYFPFTFLRS